MHEHGSLPRARKDGLLEETVGQELLLYDRDSHTAHCLSPIAACVWRHCDGERDVTKLAALAGVSESLVTDALHELREKDLLAAEPELMQSTVESVSRREAIVRGARYGAAAAAVPLIVSATAATPAMASSGEEEEKEYELKEVEGKKQSCQCVTPAKYNCCLCQKACIYDIGDKEECENKKCKNQGGFLEWKEKATYKVVG
jgi:hypothetical protein